MHVYMYMYGYGYGDMDIDMDMDLDMDMYGGGHVRFCKGAVHAPDAPDAQLWDCGCVQCFVPIS